MVELNHVHDTDSDTRVESLTGLTIIKNGLAIAINTGLIHELSDFFIGCTIEDRSGNLKAELLTGIA